MTMAAKQTGAGVEPVSAPYWEAARAGRLLLQQCGQCGRIRHYPRVLCDVCFSFAVSWVESPGLGVIYSWTVAHHAFAPDVAGDVPYVLATVDLAEGVRVLGRLSPGTDPGIGMDVRVRFAASGDGPPMLLVQPID